MQTQITETAARFISIEAEADYVDGIAKAAGKHAKADRNLVGSLIASARLIGRPVSEDDWTAHLASAVRKAVAAKVDKASVKVYVSHAKCVTRAATGRPALPVYAADGTTIVSPGLPYGKHWADQRSGRKPEGIVAYVKRVSALLKLATPNEAGELILPEGYDLLGNAPKAAAPEATEAAPAAPEATGSAGEAAKAEGGLNVDPAKAKAEARETAAIVLLGNAKTAAAFLALIDTNEGRLALAELMANPPAPKAAKAPKLAKAA